MDRRPAWLLACLLLLAQTAFAQSICRAGFEDSDDPTLRAAPVVSVLRDDRVATLEMDYDGENAWGQWWTMSGTGRDDAGFLVTWWPQDATSAALDKLSLHGDGGMTGC